MRFWDSSAIIPLIVEESASARMRDLYESDRGMLVWWGTLVKCRSGLARRERAPAHSDCEWQQFDWKVAPRPDFMKEVAAIRAPVSCPEQSSRTVIVTL